MSVLVRPAVHADADAIVSMSRSFSAEEEQESTLFGIDDYLRFGFGAERLFDPFIAELDGQAIGYAFSVRSYDTQLAGPVREIVDLYVDPAHRRHGAGAQLVKAVAEYAKQNAETAMIARVWVKNVAAHQFYETCGAQEDHVKVYYWQISI